MIISSAYFDWAAVAMERAFALASQAGVFERAFFESLGIVVLFKRKLITVEVWL